MASGTLGQSVRGRRILCVPFQACASTVTSQATAATPWTRECQDTGHVVAWRVESLPATPHELPSRRLPSSGDRTAGSTPKKGRVAEPGLRGVTAAIEAGRRRRRWLVPGRGVIMIPPLPGPRQGELRTREARRALTFQSARMCPQSSSASRPRLRSTCTQRQTGRIIHGEWQSTISRPRG